MSELHYIFSWCNMLQIPAHQLLLHGTMQEGLVKLTLRCAENQCKHNWVLTLAAYGGCWLRQHSHDNNVSWWWICCASQIINHCFIWPCDCCALDPQHMCPDSSTALRCALHQCKHKWECLVSAVWSAMWSAMWPAVWSSIIWDGSDVSPFLQGIICHNPHGPDSLRFELRMCICYMLAEQLRPLFIPIHFFIKKVMTIQYHVHLKDI